MFLSSPTNEPTEIYVIADAQGNGEEETRESSIVRIIFDRDVLTVFTSPETLRDYTKAYFPEDGPVQPVAYALNPLRLMSVVSQLEDTKDLKYLVFDPSAVCDGRWSEPQIKVPAKAYLRYIAALIDGESGTFEQLAAKLDDHFAGSEGRAKLLAWIIAQEKEVIAKAAYEAGVLEEDSWSEDPYFPTGS